MPTIVKKRNADIVKQTLDAAQSYQQAGQRYGQIGTSSPRYANHIEVQRNTHDATLTFYRVGANSSAQIAEITVPLSVLVELES